MNEVKITIEVGGSVAVMVVPSTSATLTPAKMNEYMAIMQETFNRIAKA